MALLFLGLVAACASAPIAVPRLLGGLAVVAWGISLLSLLLAILFLRPILASAYLLVCIAAAQLGPGSRPVELIHDARVIDVASNETGQALRLWLEGRPDLDAYRQGEMGCDCVQTRSGDE